MSDKIEILNHLKRNLQKVLGNKIQKVILFDSWIRNEGNEYSDIDVLIVSDKILSWREKNLIRDVCFDLSVDYEVLVDSKIISQEEIENKFWGKHPLITDALEKGVYAARIKQQGITTPAGVEQKNVHSIFCKHLIPPEF